MEMDSDLSQNSENTAALVIHMTFTHFIFMSSLCGVYVHVRVSNLSSETTRPRDMLFFF